MSLQPLKFLPSYVKVVFSCYSCKCIPGYEGDGVTCTNIDECAGENNCDSRPERGICTDTEGSYTCGCRSGFSLTSSNICEDVNECNDKSEFILIHNNF